MGHELEQPREALTELFDRCGLHPKNVRITPVIVTFFRERIGYL